MNESLDQEGLGARIRAARTARGWSLNETAHRADVSENTLISMEQGKRRSQRAKVDRVLAVLGLAPAATFNFASLPGDVTTFLRVAGTRIAELDERQRERLLSRLYPQIFEAIDELVRETDVQAEAREIVAEARDIVAQERQAPEGVDDVEAGEDVGKVPPNKKRRGSA